MAKPVDEYRLGSGVREQAETILVVLAACAPKIISYILEHVIVGMLLFTHRQVNAKELL